MKLSEKTFVTLSLLGFVGCVLGLSLNLGPTARLVPVHVAVPTFLLLAVLLVLDITGKSPKSLREILRLGAVQLGKDVGKIHPRPDSTVHAGTAPKTSGEIALFGWLIAVFAFIYLVGFTLGLSLFCIGYLRFRSRETWVNSIFMGAALGGITFGIFHLALNIPLDAGLLLRL
jgi:hypothetical protein